jgi:CCR4-NOT transcription complex subunit 4
MELASKDDAKGRCPACRTEYDEDAISFDAVPEEELAANAQRAKKREGKAGAANANANANERNQGGERDGSERGAVAVEETLAKRASDTA